MHFDLQIVWINSLQGYIPPPPDHICLTPFSFYLIFFNPHLCISVCQVIFFILPPLLFSSSTPPPSPYFSPFNFPSHRFTHTGTLPPQYYFSKKCFPLLPLPLPSFSSPFGFSSFIFLLLPTCEINVLIVMIIVFVEKRSYFE